MKACGGKRGREGRGVDKKEEEIKRGRERVRKRKGRDRERERGREKKHPDNLKSHN